MRFVASEITPGRVWHAIDYRIRNLFHVASWYLSEDAKTRRGRIEKFRNKHQGERCFVIANGPSLKTMDLSRLRGEITIGMNRVYLMFDGWGFETTYLACVNSLVLDQFAKDIDSLRMPKFLNWVGRSGYDVNNEKNNFVRLEVSLRDRFETDISRPIGGGGTVTFASLQLAYFMGFSEVILIGLDHSFVEKGRPNRTEVRISEIDESHCHPDYFPKGVKWQLPDLYRSELSYALARQAFEADGRKIIDATVGGKCDVFEKVDFVSIA